MAQRDHDVGTNSDWQGQAIRQVDGTPVLLIRNGEAIHAVAGRCPHAGGPLAQGAYHDGRIICPWHKATFCVRTGTVLEPPAVDAPRPVTDFLDGVARNRDGSLTVDATLRAAEGLFAAGDVARFPLRGDGAPIRVEHWRVAEQHGRLAALAMLGRAVRYDAVPVFWTIQYLKRLDYVGHAEDWDDIVVHGDLEKPEFIAYYVKDGRIVTAVGLDRDHDTAALVELFTIRRDWTPEALGPEPASVLGRMAGT